MGGMMLKYFLFAAAVFFVGYYHFLLGMFAGAATMAKSNRTGKVRADKYDGQLMKHIGLSAISVFFLTVVFLYW